MTGPQPSVPAAVLKPEPLLLRALAGVLHSAQEGELPLFVRTLGLPQPALLQMVGCCFPSLDYHEPIPERKYAALMASVPPLFNDVHAMLVAQRTPLTDLRHADWLARAFAGASLGQRFLWQDMGLAGREELAALLQRYFEPLHRRNTSDLKWKRFLLLELGALRQQGASAAGQSTLPALAGGAAAPGWVSRGSVR